MTQPHKYTYGVHETILDLFVIQKYIEILKKLLCGIETFAKISV